MNEIFKSILGLLVYSTTIIVIAGACLFWWGENDFRKPGPLKDNVFFTVEKGEGVMKIADGLQTAGAIDNEYVFIFGARILGAQHKLQAGEYQLTAALSPRDIMDKMKTGDTFKRRITAREGLTSYEVVQLLKNAPGLEGGEPPVPAEGTLLPQTYDYRLHEAKAEVIAGMQDAMKKTIDELWPKRAGNLPFSTPEEAMTLASIVEKETGVASERPRIAGVFINRLKKGMPLQSDPTVIYALTKGQPQDNGQGPLGRHIYEKDLQVDSPYNTYMRNGLPPGPIANPGRAAIEAVLNPETNNFYYFVADGTGGHVFAATLDEHNANVAKWEAIKRAKGN